MLHLIEFRYLENNNTTESFMGHEVPSQIHLGDNTIQKEMH